MGFELVYCYNCQKRLTEEDFKEGRALRVGIHTTCLACSETLLQQLTPEQQKAVLEQSRITVSSKEPARPERVPAARPPTVHGHPAPPAGAIPQAASVGPARKPTVALIAGGAAGALVLIVILVLVFSGSGDKRPPAPPSPGGVSTGDSGGGTATADPKRVQEAVDALRKARAFEQANPKDYAGIVRLYESAARAAEGTPHAEEALRGRDAAVARQRTALVESIAELEKQIRALAEEKAYQKALDRLDSARPARTDPDWSRAVDRMTKEVWDAAAGNFVRVKARAIEAAELKKPPEEIASWRDEVVRWGIRQYVDDLDKALAAAGAPPAGAGAGGTSPPPPSSPPVPATAEPASVGPYETDGEGYVRNWLVAGAFPNPNRTGLRFDFLGGESSCSPSQGREIVGLDGTKAKWSAYASPETKISFHRVPHLDRSAGRDYVLAYAACWLESEVDQEVRFRIRSDDGYRLWVGDRRIAEVTAKRGIQQGEEEYGVRLPVGKHRVLLKVDNFDKDHEFMLRVVSPQGGRASGVKVWN